MAKGKNGVLYTRLTITGRIRAEAGRVVVILIREVIHISHPMTPTWQHARGPGSTDRSSVSRIHSMATT
ncbi:MAG: hypothetical protein Q9183_006006, partial [Haloplaca sp. 2 TL-2023]